MDARAGHVNSGESTSTSTTALAKAMWSTLGPSGKDTTTKPAPDASAGSPAPGSGVVKATEVARDTTTSANTNTTTTTDTASMKSQGTVSQAWYLPWAWYGSSTTIEGGKEKNAEAEGEEEPKTEAELVKEAALAHDPPSPVTIPESPIPVPKETKPKSKPDEEQNPVEKSFETHHGVGFIFLELGIGDEAYHRRSCG